MIGRLNVVDRIMMPALLLTSLYILVRSYLAGTSSIDHPITVQWVLLIVGLMYVLYQAARLGSPLLTFTTAAGVEVGCLGHVVAHFGCYWGNMWDSLRMMGGFAAITLSILFFAVYAFPVVAVTFVAWIVQWRRRNTITKVVLQMLQSDGKIDAGGLAQQLGFSEIEVRMHIARTRRKGIIPFKVDVV